MVLFMLLHSAVKRVEAHVLMEEEKIFAKLLRHHPYYMHSGVY